MTPFNMYVVIYRRAPPVMIIVGTWPSYLSLLLCWMLVDPLAADDGKGNLGAAKLKNGSLRTYKRTVEKKVRICFTRSVHLYKLPLRDANWPRRCSLWNYPSGHLLKTHKTPKKKFFFSVKNKWMCFEGTRSLFALIKIQIVNKWNESFITGSLIRGLWASVSGRTPCVNTNRESCRVSLLMCRWNERLAAMLAR